MMRFGALSLSGLLLVALSCGGGGGGSSTGGTTGGSTQITSPEEAQAVTAVGLRLIKSGIGLGQMSNNLLNSQSVKKRGWLMYIMSMYPHLKGLKAQGTQTENCPGGGTVTLTTDESDSTVSISVNFDNCVTEDSSTINGSVSMSGTDADGNGMPEYLSISIKGGFSVYATDGNLYVQKDLNMSIRGNNGDIYDNNENTDATMTIDGGPAEMEAEGKKFVVSYDKLSVYIKTQGEWYELAVNGGIAYKDNFCVTDGVSLSIKTVEHFEGYAYYCEYKGKMSINNDAIVVEAYDNDNNPYFSNYIKVTYNGEVIYNGLCEEFTLPETCQ
ncbi:hypothetical protein JCM9492_01070 [Aquifex pyrophilus]